MGWLSQWNYSDLAENFFSLTHQVPPTFPYYPIPPTQDNEKFWKIGPYLEDGIAYDMTKNITVVMSGNTLHSNITLHGGILLGTQCFAAQNTLYIPEAMRWYIAIGLDKTAEALLRLIFNQSKLALQSADPDQSHQVYNALVDGALQKILAGMAPNRQHLI
jgi:hypothetical protein